MNERDMKRIEDYLDGILSTEERQELETQLAKDQAMQTALQWHKDVRQVALAKEELRLKKLMQNKSQKQAKTARLQMWAYAATAAIIVIMLGIVWYYSRPQQSDLFAEYFEPYPNVSVPIERNQPVDNLKLRAFQSYESENYALAVLQLDSLLQIENITTYRFYYANALLVQQQYQAAVNEFLALNNLNESNDFTQQTEWYLALAYLKNGKHEVALSILQRISQAEGHVFQKQAVEILSGI